MCAAGSVGSALADASLRRPAGRADPRRAALTPGAPGVFVEFRAVFGVSQVVEYTFAL
jgi:hypothetical protein